MLPTLPRSGFGDSCEWSEPSLLTYINLPTWEPKYMYMQCYLCDDRDLPSFSTKPGSHCYTCITRIQSPRLYHLRAKILSESINIEARPYSTTFIDMERTTRRVQYTYTYTYTKPTIVRDDYVQRHSLIQPIIILPLRKSLL